MLRLKNIFTIKRIVIFILLVSLAGNAYYFGRMWFNKEMAKYYNAGVIYVFQQGEKLGQVGYTDKDGKTIQLILSSKCQRAEEILK